MANERARALRRNRTKAEQQLWFQLRALKAIGFKFRQQVPIDHFVVDFACYSARLIIEVDGGTHGTDGEFSRDLLRERYLTDQGFRVLRFWNNDVVLNTERVMDTIIAVLESPPPPTPPREGEGSGARADLTTRKRSRP
jgi:very-short-patch-repair endonuclease